MPTSPRRPVLSAALIPALAAALTFYGVRHASSAQQNFTLTSPRLQGNQLTLKVGEEEQLAVTVTDASLPAGTQVVAPASDEFLEVTPTPNGVRLKALKPAPLLTLTFTLQDKRQDIKVTINPNVTQIAFSPQLFAAGAAKEITLVEGEQIPIAMTLPGGGAIPDTVQLQSTNSEAVTANNVATPRRLEARKAFTELVDVNVLSDGAQIDTFKVRVLERVTRIAAAERQISITRNQFLRDGSNVMPYSALDITAEGSQGGVLPPDRLDFRTAPSTVAAEEEGEGLEIRGDGEVTIEVVAAKVSHPLATGGAQATATLLLSIQPSPNSIVIEPNFFPLRATRTQDVQATVLDAQNQPLDVNVEWKLKDENDKQFVRLFRETKNKVKVAVIAAKSTPVEIEATAGEKTESAFVLAREELAPTGLADILVRLDLVDDQMARDLYGKKTLEEFYVTKIRIYNNRTNANGDLTGDSIIVFSESVEVGVSLEKKPVEGGGGWTCLTREEVQIIRSAMGLRNVNLDPREPSPGARNRDRGSSDQPWQASPGCYNEAEGASGQSGQNRGAGAQGYLVHFPIPYRPYTFEMVANTHDRRDERGIRHRALKALGALGSGASFVTSIAVPGDGSDLPLGLDKYRNVFVPGIERLWPDLKEVQRQNLISQLMKPLEEVPSGSDISRVLFFPKKEMKGVLPGYKVRINGISTYELKIQVAVVKKTNVEQQ